MKALILILVLTLSFSTLSQDHKNQKISQAEFFVANGELDKAIEIYEQIFNSEPTNFKIAKRLAELHLWSENVPGAISVYETLLKNNVSNHEILIELGRWYIWIGRQNEAISVYEKLAALYPDSVNFRKTLAKLYVWNNRANDAIVVYEELIKREPHDYETMIQLAQQYVWNGQQSKAIPLYQKLVDKFPDSLNYHWMLCQLLVWNNKADLAKKELKRFLKKFPAQKEAIELAMHLHYYSGEWDKAQDYAQKLLKIEPENNKAQELIAKIKASYSDYIFGEVKWFKDTNKLTKVTYPFGVKIFANRFWEFGIDLEKINLIDDRVVGKISGYGLASMLRYNFTRGNFLDLVLGGVKYGCRVFPNWKFSVNLNLFDRLYSQFEYRRIENREGVKAIQEGILIDGFALTLYAQILKSVGLSFLFDYGIYSDGNIKKTLGSYLNLFALRGNPRVLFTGFYAFEDFDSIYVNSLPYWTPNNLSTYWGEISIETDIFKWFTFGTSGAIAKNPKYPTSLNYRVFVKLMLGKFEIYGQHERYGSTVYRYEFSRAYLKFRI